jgi:ribosomal protein L32E
VAAVEKLYIAACSIAHSTICTRLFCGKMHSDRFNEIEIVQGRWQRGEKVGYCYPSGLEKTLCKWDINVPLVTKKKKNVSIS